MRKKLLVLIVLGTATFGCSRNYEDSHQKKIMDSVNILTTNQKAVLTQIIEEVKTENGAQIDVLIIKDLNGRPIEQYSEYMFSRQNLWDDNIPNRVLLTISLGNRRMRIEVSKSLVGVISSEKAKTIIDQKMVPMFKKEKYYEGIYDGLHEIQAELDNIGSVN